MYMREMGTVELLTREGEIEIAKRIEDGLGQVLSALATYPESIAELLREYAKVQTAEVRLSDVISGFIDLNAVDVEPTPPPVSRRWKPMTRIASAPAMMTRMKTARAAIPTPIRWTPDRIPKRPPAASRN